jgi:SAM-dependent methyltransferase
VNKPVCCLACGSHETFDLFSLGKVPPVNGFSVSSNSDNALPLDVYVCLNCWLCQLKAVPDPEHLFRDYKHFSGASRGNLQHLESVANNLAPVTRVTERRRALEIGCNDGSLLKLLKSKGYDCVGVDPAINMQQAQEKLGLTVIHDFFEEHLAARLLKSKGPFELIVALNVLAHFPAFMSAFKGIRTLLTPRGILHMEVADATETLANGRFDTVYHEHVCNYTLTSIDAVLRIAGLRGIHAEKVDTQGGSLRILATREDGELETKETYQTLLDREQSAGVNTKEFYLAVKAKTAASLSSLSTAYADFCRDSAPVVLLGAPARGVVMCNSTALRDIGHLHCIDDTPAKQGCVIPGTEIPVGGWEVLKMTQATKAILLSWNYRESMLARLASTGFTGQVLIPLPELEIVTI